MKAEIPDAMIESRIEELVQDFQYRISQQGLKLEQYLQYMGMTMEQFKEQFREQADKQVKMRLAMEAIVAKESIEATEEEFEAEIKRIADAYQMEADKVKSLVDAAAVLDISLRIHIKAATERIDLGASLALCLCPACSWGLRRCSWCAFRSGRLCSASVSGAFFWRWYWVLWILFVFYYTHSIFLAFCSLVSVGSHVAVGRHWLKGYL